MQNQNKLKDFIITVRVMKVFFFLPLLLYIVQVGGGPGNEFSSTLELELKKKVIAIVRIQKTHETEKHNLCLISLRRVQQSERSSTVHQEAS